ncbi:hypothetical protein ACHQM5_016944 [Ranunculus cassubicifolius]
MFFSIRSKLISLLQPYLQSEPDLELKLGFLHSHGIANNLRFDVSALNRLLDDSIPFNFSEIRVQTLNIQFSPWSSCALTIEVTGLYVKLNAREPAVYGESRTNWEETEKKTVLSVIDPEGTVLHEAVERISIITSRNRLMTSLINFMFTHCRLLLHDIHLELQLCGVEDAIAPFSKIKELHFGTSHHAHTCLFRGLIGSLIIPRRVCSFVLSASMWEIGLKRDKHISRLFSVDEFKTCVKLKNLQLLDVDISAPQLNVSFTPLDLSVLQALDKLAFKDIKPTRNGRDLWRIAASRIYTLTPIPKLSFYKLVGVVRLWLKYVHCYESLLVLLGYPVGSIFEKSSNRMSVNKKFSTHVKNQWTMISIIEKELSIEVLARARRIARQRATVYDQNIERSNRSILEANRNVLLMIPSIFNRFICFIFVSIIRFFVRADLNRHPKVDGMSRVISGDSYHPQYCFNCRKVSITVLPAIPCAVSGTSESPVGISQLNLLFFCVTLDAFFLLYAAGSVSQSVSLSCGDVKVNSSSLIIPSMQSSRRKSKERPTESKVILWGEPAPKSLHPKEVATHSTYSAGDGCSLENCLDELWLNWKNIYENVEGSGLYVGDPFLLCEIKGSLMNQSLDQTDIGIWKCHVSMGKLNVDLGYSSIISIGLLQRQIEHAMLLFTCHGKTVVPSQTPIIKEAEEIKWEFLQQSYVSETKMTVLKMIPEKNIQMGIVIVGPKIRMSLLDGLYTEKEKKVSSISTQDQGNYYIAFSLESITMSVWPTSKTDLATSIKRSKLDDVDSENLKSNESRSPNNLGEHLNEAYIFRECIALRSCILINGLIVYMGDSEDDQQHQLIGLKSILVQSSSCRECTQTFTTNVIALSTSLFGTTTEAIVLLYMDEFNVLFKVTECVLSALSYASTNLDLTSSVHLEEAVRETEISTGRNPDEFTEAHTNGLLLIRNCTQIVADASFKFGSVDIIMQGSRKNQLVELFKTVYGSSNNHMQSGQNFPEYGIAAALQNSHVQMQLEENQVNICTGISGLQMVIFQYENQVKDSRGAYELRNLLYRSPSCLYEFALSNFSLALCSGSQDAINSYSSIGTSNSVEGALAILSEGSDIQLSDSNQRVRSMASNLLLPSSVQLVIDIALGEIIMSEHSTKDFLTRAHQQKELVSSLCIGRENQAISWTIQGGLIILETTAVAMFSQCLNAYLLWIQNASTFSSREYISSHGQSSSHPRKELLLGSIDSTSPTSNLRPCDKHPESKLQLLDAVQISLSQFSLILVIEDGSGGLGELLFEADFQLNLEKMNSRRKLLFILSRMTILSRHMHGSCSEHIDKLQILRFSPVPDNVYSPGTVSGDLSPAFQSVEDVLSTYHDESSSTSPVSQEESMVENDVARKSQSIHENVIMKHAAASIMVEKATQKHNVNHMWLNVNWIGRGSVSGLDLMISLSEIQMILSLIEPLSGGLSEESAGNSEQRIQPRDQESDNVLEHKIPDGAIIAIQDLHQHTYLAVEDVDNNYQVTGTIHYSLVGEKALFRVSYCNQKKWGSSTSWFTLISLYAKSGSGEPLRLNYRSGSGFVNISDNDDNSSLWSTLPFKIESYEADNDFGSYSEDSTNTFRLVNKKCDCAVAFIDGVLEFVKKPGNPFKVKLFPNVSLAHNDLRLDMNNEGIYDQDTEHHTNEDEKTNGEGGSQPCIDITFDRVVLTIVHEIPDSSEKFPLLQICIENIQFIVQVLCSKARIICTFGVAICYFDAQGNLWRELVRPAEMFVFYRTRFETQSSEIVSKRVSVHFYFKIKQVDVFITELSLDILLFVVGELGFAGPFAVKSSVIFANCCKIQNQSSLSLLCRFYDCQDATVSGKQSTSVFIRPVALAKLPEKSAFLSIQLAAAGDLITSPINVSLLKDRIFAWRTRVTSLNGPKTSPGPFVVVDVSKKTEDGLSVVVSPLLRIHNETGFSMEILFWRPQNKESESASVILRNGDTIDDSMAALDALNLNGGSKKVLMSITLGNFLFCCRPEISQDFGNLSEPVSVGWSEELKGGKAVRLSGVFDKLSYKVRQAFGVGSMKISVSTVHCSLRIDGAHITDLHFLVQTVAKNVPLVQPDDFKGSSEARTAPVALQEQKEIFLLPTVHISNHLQSEIHVLLTETNPDISTGENSTNIGKQETISCGSSAYLYANPAMIYFTVTLTAFGSKCKAVNSVDWIKKLQKKKSVVDFLDISLDFGGGKYFASLRLSRSDRGILEAAVYTSYILQNASDLSLFCFASDQKPLSRQEVDKFGSRFPPDIGTSLPPNSTRSWFLKSNRMNFKLLEGDSSSALLDLDVITGFTEVCLESRVGTGVRCISKLGVSLSPCATKISVPSQILLIVPRYIISNETEEAIFVRQHELEEEIEDVISLEGKQKAALQMKIGTSNRRELSVFDSIFRKHKHSNEDHFIYIQFRLKDIGWSWSGPICVSSLGHFSLKFRRQNQSSSVTGSVNKLTEFAVVHIVEEGSSLVLHFDRPPNLRPPYRIENLLPNACITYCQKGLEDPESLGCGNSAGYVWDDLSLPHQLVVQISGINLSREINMDKVRAWKPLFKVRQQRGLALDLPLDKKPRDQIKGKDESHGSEMLKVGYEVYADGATRVLRISEFPGRGKDYAAFHLCAKIQFRVSNLAIHLLENTKQEENVNEPSVYSPVVIARIDNISLESTLTDQNKFNQLKVQSINVDEKWEGAPFAAILRRNESDYSDTSESILQIVFILLSADSGVKKVKYSSIVLQPLQLNLDEETLIRFVPFWRTSLSDSNTPSQQFYFEHFEIHPVKVVASFLPGSSGSTYSSAQETLRSFLHSIIKIPAVKNKNVELNGILLTHALVTVRELFFKCARHYSWYGMRAVYIAKGSPLLPPAFASIFDDSASSSLDIFFDPSSGLVNLPGITLGMFKFVSKCIDRKGFSGTKRYFGDLGKTVKTAGSNVLFAAITEISDSVLKGAEANGVNGMVNGFHQGILKLAMEPSVLGTAVMEGGPDRKIKLDRSPGVDELYVEGYLQAMLDTMYTQGYLRVRVLDNQVTLKNLPPNSTLMNEIMDRVRGFLISKGLLIGEASTAASGGGGPLRHLRGGGEREWKFGATIRTLVEHLFVSFAIRMLRKQAFKALADFRGNNNKKAIVKAPMPEEEEKKGGFRVNLKWGVRKFVFSGLVAYIDGRLCRSIPNALARRIVSGFLLSLLDDDRTQ